ncbi:MAG: dihydropteroate synthase [Verrucomicrobia bacterium]|nr:dihydropteroate synthase [Verrucomicrobiota bacterium]NBS78992.1 dihydropteroate synthase [bacterium]NBT24189.1 dihydropteroate synthase [bacterium]NBY66411.1 dihydropteroate synthase [Verrucomicrobiota bacterium]
MNSPATHGWQCGNRRIEIKATRPFLLGILNVTPDSFSDGGRFQQVGAAVRHGLKLCEEGDGVDVGGESTRPGATPISAQEERERVIPVLRQIRRERPDAFLSVDTYKVEVARAAYGEAGVDVVNDVGAGRWDEGLWEWVAGAGVGYVCMHAGGRPQEMQKNPSYQNVVGEVGRFFEERMQEMGRVGIEPERVVLDVGVGFGKSSEHNRALLEGDWGGLCRPLMWGLSRKSFLAVTERERGLGSREEALDWWHRELMRKGRPMVWRVHEPAGVRSGLS